MLYDTAFYAQEHVMCPCPAHVECQFESQAHNYSTMNHKLFIHNENYNNYRYVGRLVPILYCC